MACGGDGCCRGADCESRMAGVPVAPVSMCVYCGIRKADVGSLCFWCDEVVVDARHYTVENGQSVECDCGNEAPVCYEVLGEEIGKLVDVKNAAYGDSFAKTGSFLALLYPNGVQPEQYGDLLAVARVFDKLMRIATDRDALGESPWRDIAGYALLAVQAAKNRHGQ